MSQKEFILVKFFAYLRLQSGFLNGLPAFFGRMGV